MRLIAVDGALAGLSTGSAIRGKGLRLILLFSGLAKFRTRILVFECLSRAMLARFALPWKPMVGKGDGLLRHIRVMRET